MSNNVLSATQESQLSNSYIMNGLDSNFPPQRPYPLTQQAKMIYLYRDGDLRHEPLRVPIHSNRYRSMESLMNDMTERMPELNYGVRAVFTPKGRDRVKNLEEFDHEGHYVCADNEKRAKGINVEKVHSPLLGRGWNRAKPPNGRNRRDMASNRQETAPHLPTIKNRVSPQRQTNSYPNSDSEFTPQQSRSTNTMRKTECKRVYVRKNGDPRRRHVLLLNRRMAKSFEHILDDLSGMFLMPVRRIYTEEGEEINSLSAVFNGPDHLVAAGFEPFRFELAWTGQNENGSPKRLNKTIRDSSYEDLSSKGTSMKRRMPAGRLMEKTRLVGKAKSEGIWRVWVTTRSDNADCGTTANVNIVVYGSNAVSDPIPLLGGIQERLNGHTNYSSIPFQAGQIDEFEISIGAVHDIYKIRLSHDNSGSSPCWFVGDIRMRDVNTDEELLFHFNRWLSRDKENDGDICREAPALRHSAKKTLSLIRYRVRVVTGDCWNAGTEANVFIRLFGTQGDTGMRQIWKPLNRRQKPFQQGNIDVFEVEAVDLGRLQRCIIAHDGQGAGEGWFLEKIAVQNGAEKASSNNSSMGSMNKYSSLEKDSMNSFVTLVEFFCFRWLDEAEEDGKIMRELRATDTVTQNEMQREMWEYEKWKFQDGNEIQLYSRVTDKAIRILEDGNVDANGQFDDPQTFFRVYCTKTTKSTTPRQTVSSLNNIIVLQSCVFEMRYLAIDRNTLLGGSLSTAFCEFSIHSLPDRTLLLESVKYPLQHVNVSKTGVRADPRGPPTLPGKVFHAYCKGVFRPGSLILFCSSLTQTLSVDHDNSVRATGKRNRLAHFIVRKQSACVRLFESAVFPEQFLRIKDNICDCLGSGDLYCQFRVTKFRTHGFVTLESMACKGFFVGMQPDGSVVPMVSTGEKNVRFYPEVVRFIQGTEKRAITPIKQENILLSTPKLKAIEGIEPERNVEAEEEEDVSSDNSRDYITENDWKLLISTSQSAQDADISIFVYGDEGHTGPIYLGSAGTPDGLFLAGNTDEFKIKLNQVGEIYKIRVELQPHEWNISPFWNIKEVILENCITEDRLLFPFGGRSFSRDSEDCEICREVPLVFAGEEAPAIVHYEVRVYTGDVPGADTMAHVYVCLVGEHGDSGRRFIFNKTNVTYCQRGQMDSFTIEALDLGRLQHCVVGHDNEEPGQGWFCEKVVVLDPLVKEEVAFPCSNWLDTGREDKLVERILRAENYISSNASIQGEDLEAQNLERIELDAQLLVNTITEQVVKNIEEYHLNGQSSRNTSADES